MKRTTSFLGNLFGLSILAALVLGLVALLRGMSLGAGEQPVSPLWTSTLQPPLQSPLQTPTSVPTSAPTATPEVIPPPPGWPTDQPWPPQPTPPTPQPTTASRPFPTPAFSPTPRGTRPAKLQSIWFPYFPDPASSPQLREVQVDQQGQRWSQSARRLNLSLPKPEPGPDPGPILTDLHVSPNSRWLVADFAYVGSRLVDMSTGMIQPLVADTLAEPWRFLAWTPDGQRILVSSNRGFELFNLVSGENKTVGFPKSEFSPYVNAVAYSPDGKQIADALIYPAVYSVREIEMTEIGLRNGENGERKPIIQIPGGMQLIDHSLRWSPNGYRLIWIVVVADKESPRVELSRTQVQLWMADLTKNDAKAIKVLGEAVEYSHQAAWSPDGRYIAIVKVEDVSEGKDVANNIYVFDLESGIERQLTHLTNRRLSHLNWSPDGQWIAFATMMGDYSEIWLASSDGAQQYPIAGPAITNAPLVWLP